MADKHLGLDLPHLGGLGGAQIAVERNDGGHIRAASGQFQNGGAAEAIADRSRARDIDVRIFL